jgi:hypothetical protein
VFLKPRVFTFIVLFAKYLDTRFVLKNQHTSYDKIRSPCCRVLDVERVCIFLETWKYSSTLHIEMAFNKILKQAKRRLCARLKLFKKHTQRS